MLLAKSLANIVGRQGCGRFGAFCIACKAALNTEKTYSQACINAQRFMGPSACPRWRCAYLGNASRVLSHPAGRRSLLLQRQKPDGSQEAGFTISSVAISNTAVSQDAQAGQIPSNLELCPPTAVGCSAMDALVNAECHSDLNLLLDHYSLSTAHPAPQCLRTEQQAHGVVA